MSESAPNRSESSIQPSIQPDTQSNIQPDTQLNTQRIARGVVKQLPGLEEAETMPSAQDPAFVSRVASYQRDFERARTELAKAIVGQHDVINNLLEALVANGHVLVEGLPGIAKTLLVRSMARVTGCEFKRIQFTPDLLPTDIIGITTYEEGKGFYTIKGPIFANFVLADEINRAPPKVQSALLEAMQEKQVTIGNQTFPLPQPFFVMATQNPVENIGTYPLPEAQVDRFLFKILMGYLEPSDEILVMHRNMTLNRFEDLGLSSVLTPDLLTTVQKEVRLVYLDSKVEHYIVRIVEASRHPDRYGVTRGKYIAYGGSPRSTIALFIAAKARALVLGRTYVTPHDVKIKAHDVLRHRIILNYEGQAEAVSPDAVIDEILAKVPVAER
jgi:MoxR-like ATPase